MTGIVFFAVLIGWFLVCRKLAQVCSSRLEAGVKRRVAYVLSFALLFVLPVVDEIVGGFQFRAMCDPAYLLSYDAERVKGKTVFTKDSSDQYVNKVVKILVQTREWLDVDTEEVLVTHRMMTATGGWLSRFVGFPQGSPPYTFDGHCDSREYYELMQKLDIQDKQ